MNHTDDKEKIARLLRETCRPVAPPLDVKEQIRERLVAEIEWYSEGTSEPWANPRLIIPILASIASGLIAYGCWLAMTLV